MSAEPSNSELRALVSQLTLDEKLLLLAGKNVWETNEIERLNIPSLKVCNLALLVPQCQSPSRD